MIRLLARFFALIGAATVAGVTSAVLGVLYLWRKDKQWEEELKRTDQMYQPPAFSPSQEAAKQQTAEETTGAKESEAGEATSQDEATASNPEAPAPKSRATSPRSGKTKDSSGRSRKGKKAS